jgi:hypothetical protein
MKLQSEVPHWRDKVKAVLGIILVFSFLGLGLVTTAQAQSDAGLVAEWHFDEGSGTILRDSSGNGNDGTIHGATWVDGKSGKALSFDGKDDYVNIPNHPSLNPETAITISAWYKPVVSFEGAGVDPIVDKGYYSHTAPSYQYHLGVTGDRYDTSRHSAFSFSVALDGAAKGVHTDYNFWVLGTWYYLVGTYDGEITRLYVNGEVVSAKEGQGELRDYGKDVYIATYTNYDEYLPGTIDEVRIYNRALTAEEIKANYDALTAPTVPSTLIPTPAPTPVPSVSDEGLVAEWHFDEGSGTVLRDSSGNGNDGTIYGATWVDEKSGKALSFDGRDDYVEVPTPYSPINEFSIEAWIKTTSTARQTIFGGSTGNDKFHPCFGVGYGGTANKAGGCVNRDGTYIHSNVDVNTGYWNHIVLVANDGGSSTTNMKIYVNGVLDADINDPFVIRTWTETHYIGKRESEYYFNGIIDEIRIYNRALSASEIKAHYDEVMAPTPTPTPTSAISYPSTVEAPTATPSAEAQAKDSNLMLYGLIGAIGIVGVVIAVKVGGNVASKARERKEEKMQEQREREEYERKIKEWEDQGYKVSEMKEELKK